MIDGLDDTLKGLLLRNLAAINPLISFATPDKEWTSTISGPTINLFLYDIRENIQLRSNEHYLAPHDGGWQHSIPPSRIDFTYLISVWTKKEQTDSSESPHIRDEHMLLGKILSILLAHPILPEDVLQGDIKQQAKIPGGQLPRAWIAQPEDTPKTWEFWGSNEWRLKAGIAYRVTLYVQPMLPLLPPPLIEPVQSINLQLETKRANPSAPSM